MSFYLLLDYLYCFQLFYSFSFYFPGIYSFPYILPEHLQHFFFTIFGLLSAFIIQLLSSVLLINPGLFFVNEILSCIMFACIFTMNSKLRAIYNYLKNPHQNVSFLSLRVRLGIAHITLGQL